MAIESTYFLDAANLSSATSVYTNIGLTTKAPDGIYGADSISRQQLAGILLTAVPCNCTPTLTLQGASCRMNNCGDNSTCGVHLPVNVTNAPVGYYIQMETTMASGASATYSQIDGYVVYTESSALGSLQIKLNMFDYPGGTLLVTTGFQTITHQSFWSSLPTCS